MIAVVENIIITKINTTNFYKIENRKNSQNSNARKSQKSQKSENSFKNLSTTTNEPFT
jgi:hypothetical protein